MASETEHLMGLQENRLATVKEEEEDKGRPSSWLEKKGWKDEVFGRVVLLGKRGVWIILVVSAAIFSIAPSLSWLVGYSEEKEGGSDGERKWVWGC